MKLAHQEGEKGRPRFAGCQGRNLAAHLAVDFWHSINCEVGYAYGAWCFTFPVVSVPSSALLGQTRFYSNKIIGNHVIEKGHAQDGSRFVKEPHLEQQSANDVLPVIPYVEPKEEKPADFSSTLSSTMPMAAVSDMTVRSRAPSLTFAFRCSQETGKLIPCGL
jgi:hypothetical protein